MPEQKLVPAKLYKYEPFSEQSLQNLNAQGIYFGSPANFNDPYDCALEPVIVTPSDAEIDAIRTSYLCRPLASQLAFEIRTLSTDELREKFIRSGKRAIHDAQEAFKNRGVSCFSESNDDLLMWSHYGGKHKGFCLEFDTTYEPFQKIRKVSYSSRMPQINIADHIQDIHTDDVMDLFSTKSPSWAYEREWRCFHDKAGTLFTYPPECLTGIYFGPQISQGSLEIIFLILQGQNPHVKFWKGSRSRDEFKVEFLQYP